MKANYHTHTWRCGHAHGADRELVETAIARGLTLLGFSDHVPMPFPDGHESPFRVPIRELDGYFTSLLSLKEEYRGEIDLRIGFEAEYYPDLLPAMLDLLRPYPVDFFLLGQHYNDSTEKPWNFRPTEDPGRLKQYTDRILEALSTGLFSAAAHPDLLTFTGSPSFYQAEMRRLCEGAKALDIPLEINLLGLSEKRGYPRDFFWETAASVGNRIYLGCDAHQPDSVANPEHLAEAYAYAARFGIVPEDRIELKKPF